ncbi:MAG: cobalt ECF transporter T component CbiQ [Desulfobacterales bacterium]|nr:MAG: cobalt ECF transporter T component CbiQ [Desulfobacterales bacterium]
MINEPFAAGNSLIHNLDPRIRVGLASVYCFVIALAKHTPVLLAAIVISLSLIFITRVNPREIARRLVIVNVLIFLLWAVLPLTYGDPALFRAGPFSISGPGTKLAAQITLKCNAILLAFIALIATMPLVTLGHALNRLRVPAKIVLLLLMTYRYVFVIEQEYHRLLRAARIRGFRPGTNLHTYKTYAYVVGMLFVRAAARAERVNQAMRCRGFNGKFYTLQQFETVRHDWILATIITAMIICLLFLEWSHRA